MLAGLSMGWIVAGLGAIALPVAAHLLSRRGGRTVVFPAVRFVMRAAAEHARRHRLRDLVLLAMRAGAIALVALAFDRPVWLTQASGGADARAGRDVVVVLDASASMARTERGRSLYDVARDRAAEVLEGLDWSRDRAGVVFVRAESRAALPRLSGNREALVKRVRESEVTLERGDLSGALALGTAMPGALDVDASKVRPRRIVVIGDRQRTQWEEGEAPIGAQGEFSGVGPEAATENLAVTDVTIGGGDALTGRDVVVSATVANFSDRSRGPRVVLREVAAGDGSGARELGASVATIGPNGRATLSFTTAFGEVGVTRLEVALIDEAFTPDDIGRGVVNVLDASRIVMVTRARSGDMGSAAYFWDAALAPDERGAYRVERVAPQDFSTHTLEGAAGVVVVEAGAVPERVVEVIRRFVTGGGGIAWVVDSNESGAGLMGLAEDSGLYASVGGMESVSAGVEIRETRFDRAGMAALAGPMEGGLRSMRFASTCPARVGPAGVVLASLDNGDAWMIEGPIGGGRLIALHGALDPGRSTLVKSPVFPVLAGEIATALVRAARGAGEAHVGEPVVVEGVGPLEGVLVDERGKAVRVLDGGGGRARVGVEATGEPGFVGVVDERGVCVGAAGVNLDPRESDMRTMSDEEINAVLSGTMIAGKASGSAAGAVLGRPRPIELWGWLMGAAVVLLGAEGLVAASWGRARRRDHARGRPA